jgi:acetyltransferase-like isoleucine patch superfamily enzyme
MTDQQKARLEYAKATKPAWPKNKIAKNTKIHFTAIIGGRLWIVRFLYFVLDYIYRFFGRFFILDGFGYSRDLDGSYVKMHHRGNVEISEGCEIRAYVTIDRAVIGSTFLDVGNKLDHHVHIAHNAKIGKYNTFANGCSIEGSCEIGSFNTFGSNVTVQRKVKIGSRCRFGSGTVVVKDVPDNSIVVGNPGKVIRTNG